MNNKSILTNWRQEMCRLWCYFGKGSMKNVKHECHFHGANYTPDQDNLLSMLPVFGLIQQLLQAQIEQDAEVVEELQKRIKAQEPGDIPLDTSTRIIIQSELDGIRERLVGEDKINSRFNSELGFWEIFVDGRWVKAEYKHPCNHKWMVTAWKAYALIENRSKVTTPDFIAHKFRCTKCMEEYKPN